MEYKPTVHSFHYELFDLRTQKVIAWGLDYHQALEQYLNSGWHIVMRQQTCS